MCKKTRDLADFLYHITEIIIFYTEILTRKVDFSSLFFKKEKLGKSIFIVGISVQNVFFYTDVSEIERFISSFSALCIKENIFFHIWALYVSLNIFFINVRCSKYLLSLYIFTRNDLK